MFVCAQISISEETTGPHFVLFQIVTPEEGLPRWIYLTSFPIDRPSSFFSEMSTVLIVVDMQLDFYSRNSAVSQSFPSLASKIGQLVSLARETENVEVVHLREGSNDNVSPWYNFWSKLNPGKSSAADATTAATEPCAQDTDGEKVFVKYGYDGVGVDSGMVSYLEDKYSLEDKKPIILVCGLRKFS